MQLDVTSHFRAFSGPEKILHASTLILGTLKLPCEQAYMKHIQVILAKAILDQPASIPSGSWPQMCEWPQSKQKNYLA